MNSFLPVICDYRIPVHRIRTLLALLFNKRFNFWFPLNALDESGVEFREVSGVGRIEADSCRFPRITKLR